MTLLSLASTFCHSLKLDSDKFHYKLLVTLKSYHPWRPPLRSKQQWVPRSKSCRIKKLFHKNDQLTKQTEVISVSQKLLYSPHRSYLSILKEIAQLTTQKLSFWHPRFRMASKYCGSPQTWHQRGCIIYKKAIWPFFSRI